MFFEIRVFRVRKVDPFKRFSSNLLEKLIFVTVLETVF